MTGGERRGREGERERERDHNPITLRNVIKEQQENNLSDTVTEMSTHVHTHTHKHIPHPLRNDKDTVYSVERFN